MTEGQSKGTKQLLAQRNERVICSTHCPCFCFPSKANVTMLWLMAVMLQDDKLAGALAGGWRTFLARFTNHTLLGDSKQFRQIVMGTLERDRSQKFVR